MESLGNYYREMIVEVEKHSFYYQVERLLNEFYEKEITEDEERRDQNF